MGNSFFKKPPSRADIRRSLDQDVDAFLARGGEINQVKPGETALESRNAPLKPPLFTEPRSERTPVSDVIQDVDNRRKAQMKSRHVTHRNPRPKRKKQVIYDDFGEPLRTVWTEE